MMHIWYWGGSHSGKSAQAFSDFSATTTYVYDGGDWTGLMPHHTHIIIDDLTAALMDQRTLCRLADKNPFYVMVNGRRQLMNKLIRLTVTSLQHPEQVYEETENFTEARVRQLLNRFEVVTCGDAPGESDYEGNSMDSDEEWLASDED